MKSINLPCDQIELWQKKEMSPSSKVFHAVVEQCSEAIMITDAFGFLTYVNPAWCEIYGYSNLEAIGKKPSLLHSGQHQPEFYSSMWEEIQKKKKWKGRVVNRAKSGGFIPVMLTISSLKIDDELHFMGIAVDMRNEEDLQRQVFQQERMASLGLLSSGLAHEIGTPLGVIRGRAEILLEESNAFQKKSLEIIIRQIDRISNLIQTLLKLGRSRPSENLQSIPLRNALEEVKSLFVEKAQNKNIEIEIHLDEKIKVLGDHFQIQQILINLFLNSIHAIEDAKRDKGLIRIESIQKSSELILRFEDNGVGIEKKNLQKIFDPFFTTKDVGRGTGLGLSLVLKMLNEMKAGIEVQSDFGRGTVFFIKFNL